MAPKKKGKVNKLAKMSDEERARYLQHRADIEEEARRRKQELISRYMKNKLEKEEAFQKLNMAKINQMWRYLLRRIKCKQMGAEIKGISSTFDFMVHRKNSIISQLVRALDEAEDQHGRMLQAHMETLNYFLGLGSDRLISLQNEYELQKTTLLVKWEQESQDRCRTTDQSEYELRLIIHQQQHDMKQYTENTELRMATAKNDERLFQEEDLIALKRPKELEIESHWNELRALYMNYVERHQPIIAHYDLLREKDDFYKIDIHSNTKKLHSANKLISSLQKEWDKVNLELTSSVKEADDRHESLHQQYWNLEKENKQRDRISKERLTVLVDASEKAVTKLKENKGKVEKIIKLARVCSKYETEEERNMIRDEKFQEEHTLHFGLLPPEDFNEMMLEEYLPLQQLDKFWLKCNRVKVQTESLRAEKASLEKEHEDLKDYMKKYLTELAVQDSVVRPASVGLCRADAHEEFKSTWKDRPVTCIEAAICNAVQHDKRNKVWQRNNKEMSKIKVYTRYNCWQ